VAVLTLIGPLAIGLLMAMDVWRSDAADPTWTDPFGSDTTLSVATPVVPAVDYIRADPGAPLEDLRAAATGPIQLSTLTFYEGYLIAEVVPAGVVGAVDRWVIYPDRRLGPDRVAGSPLDDTSFPLDELPAEAVTAAAQGALVELGAPDGTVTHVRVRRGEAGIELLAYVTRADGVSAGYAAFDPAGSLLRRMPTA
jgi:hypothetical protein